jgi:DNA invertase Pin-like site-specific DNA recombinase
VVTLEPALRNTLAGIQMRSTQVGSCILERLSLMVLELVEHEASMIVGYSRVSTAEQVAGLAAQERDLTAAGAERVFKEQVSSVASRAVLTECLGFLRAGDVLVCTKPDRLARSTAELLSIEADLTKRGIGLVVLSMGGERLDTRNPTSRLMLTILAGVATWEREIMLERQREGIAKAKAEGRYKGREPTARRHCRSANARMSSGSIRPPRGLAQRPASSATRYWWTMPRPAARCRSDWPPGRSRADAQGGNMWLN